MAILMRVLPLALFLAAAGCEFVRPPTYIEAPRDRLIVHSVLTAESDTVRVLVTIPPAPTSVNRAPVAVRGALVRLSGAGQEITLVEAAEGFSGCVAEEGWWGPMQPPPGPAAAGCYAAVLPGGARPGERYSLRVEAAGYPTITGETLVPLAPDWVVSPSGNPHPMTWSMGSSGISAPLLLSWSGAPGTVEMPHTFSEATFVEGHPSDVRCAIIPVNQNQGSIGPVLRLDPDGTLEIRLLVHSCGTNPYTEGQPLPDEIRAPIALVTHDPAYAAYADGVMRSAGSRMAAFGLSGGFGVFGSVSITRRVVVLVSAG
jgi:hypothetical protein